MGALWLRYRTGAPPPVPVPAPPPYSVAVRRFLNVGPDSAADALGLGLADDVAFSLGRSAGLRVADGASVRAAARLSGDPHEIGRRLGVGSVLEGSLRLSGDQVRLTIHLVSVDRGFDLWSETFEGPASRLVAVRDSIARGVVATLRPAARAALGPTTSGDAYLAYLRGRAALAGGALDDAFTAFTEASRLDSTYAPAWAGLGETHLRELLAGYRAPSETGPLAAEAADRALALDSLDARALLVRGVVRFCYERDWEAAATDLGRVAILDPNRPEALHWQSHLFVARGAFDSSLAATREAIERSPLDAALRVHLAWHHVMAGEDTLARAELARAAAMDTAARLDRHGPLLAEAAADTTTAVAWLTGAVAVEPGRTDLLAELARLNAVSGRAGDARALLERLLSSAEARYVSPYAIAVAETALGQTRPALAALARAVDERDPEVVYLERDPRLAALRGNFRFAGLVRRLAPDYNPPTSKSRP